MLNRVSVSCGAVVSWSRSTQLGSLAQESRVMGESKACKVPRTSWGHTDQREHHLEDEHAVLDPVARPENALALSPSTTELVTLPAA